MWPTGINLTTGDRHNPRLVEKLTWEPGRFDLRPDRLCVKILESVILGAEDDIILRNVAGLAALGCGIDLDDFGTGHSANSSARE